MNDLKPPANGPGQGPFDREINFRAVLLFGLTLLGVTVLSVVLMFFLFHALQARQVALDPPPSPLAVRGVRRLPPAPRLQPQPQLELAELRAAEEAVLEHYGWVDAEAGTIHIPIERAMELTAAAAAVAAVTAVTEPAEEAPEP